MNTMPVAKNHPWNYYSNLLPGVGEDMESLKVLEVNLGHVQRDAAEIKEDQRRANLRLDEMFGRLETLRDKMDHIGGDINDHVDDVSKRVDGVSEKVARIPTDLAAQLDTVRKELTAEVKEVSAAVAAVRKDMSAEVNTLRIDVFQKIDVMRNDLFAVRASVSAAKVWTLTVLLGVAASLLGVMAHGFKWL